jgi:hypothetical protein
MNGTELAELWTARDRLYAARKVNGIPVILSDVEEDAVRAWRRKEVDLLPADERSAAYGSLTRWYAPMAKGR